MAAEEALSRRDAHPSVHAGVHEPLSRGGKVDVALRDFGKAQELKCLGDRKQIIDFHLQARREVR
jgi:hypothetical protein